MKTSSDLHPGLEQYTEWLPEDGIMRTQWGEIGCLEWCRLEALRLRVSGRHTEVSRRVTKGGYQVSAIIGTRLPPCRAVN